MNVLNRIPPWFWLTLLTLVGLLLLFGDVLIHPGAYFFSYGGDGLTPYYVTPFHARYGTGTWHEMFHYPYGNHILYVSSPLMVWIASLWESLFSGSEFIALINMSVILSYFPAVWLMYLILRRSLLPEKFAILFSLVIIFHSPQVMRITGYFGLAYVCVIPLLWYLLLPGFQDSKITRNLQLYGLAVLMFSFLHPYYALIGAAFLCAWMCVRAVQYKGEWKRYPWRYVLAIFMALAPGLLLKAWESLTWKGLSDFVAYPYGYLDYIAGFESIFLPMHEPLLGIWKTFIGVKPRDWEGYGYVGLVGLVVLIALVWRMGKHIRHRKTRRILRPVLPDSLKTAIWAGTLLLIPAMSHLIQACPSCLEYLGPLRNFRAIGRLVWPFYFVFMATAVWYLYASYRILRQGGRQNLAILLIIISTCSWGINIFIQGQSQRQIFVYNKVRLFWEKEFDFKRLLENNGYQAEDFQAIISLPYYHFGSQKLVTEDWESTRMSMALSLSTGLPICNNRSARAPISSTLRSIQLVSDPLIDRELITDLSSSKPFLVLAVPGKKSKGEQWLLDQAQFIDTVRHLSLYQLDVEALQGSRANKKAAFQADKSNLEPVRTPYGKFYMSNRTQAIFFSSHTQNPTELGLPSEIAQTQLSSADSVYLFDGSIRIDYPNTPMEFSCWVKQEHRNNFQGYLFVDIETRNSTENTSSTKRIKYPLYESRDIYKDWTLVRIPFLLKNSKDVIRIFASDPKLLVDNLLIRPEKVDVYLQSEDKQAVLFNNIIL